LTDRAHRVAWQLANNRTLADGEYVCHTCDVRLCCEPSHLWLGDHAANQRDKVLKGRNVIPRHTGTQNGMAHLTDASVLAIRIAYADHRRSHAELAAEYGVSTSTIAMITRGLNWQHVGGPIVNGRYVRWQRARSQ
jgi:hypothetical protein